MLVSIHIPKTAGTTIGYLLDYGVKRKIFYDYMGKNGYSGKVYDQDVALLQEHKEFVSKKFHVIHGHFHYKKYADIFPDADYIVCLRKPLARTISQYYHIIEEANPEHMFYEDLSSGKMSFIDFASLPHIKRAQAIFVEGRDIMDFKHVFLTEKLVESIHDFQLLTGFQRNDPYMRFSGKESIPNTNPRSARKRKITPAKVVKGLRGLAKGELTLADCIKRQEKQKRVIIPEPQLEKAKVILQEDIELYKRAQEKFAQQQQLASQRS